MSEITIYNPDQVASAQKLLVSKPLSLLPTAGPRELVARANSDAVVKDQLIAECETIMAANMPANEGQLLMLVQRLMNHYKASDVSEDDYQGVLEDWIDDLSGIPLDILSQAFSEYRKSSKGRFKPMPGDIIEISKMQSGWRMQISKRAADVLEALK